MRHVASGLVSAVPCEQTCQQVCIILPSLKEKEGEYPFEKIQAMNLIVLSSSEFIKKFNNEPLFAVRVNQQQIKCFVKFELFKRSKFYRNLLRKGVPVFPIDSKKVPHSLQDTLLSYPDYIAHMAQHFLAVTKSGQEQ